MLAAHPWLATARNQFDRLPAAQQRLYSLFWKQHNLDGIATEVNGIITAIRSYGGNSLVIAFKKLCAQWSIEVRYSSQKNTIAEAAQFISTANEIKESLRLR